MLEVHVELRQSDVLRTMLLQVGQDGLTEFSPPLDELLPHALPLLLDLLTVKRQHLLALAPHGTERIVDEGGSDSKLSRDVPRVHALQVSEQHPAFLLILLDLPALELAPGEAHPVLQPALDTCLLLVGVSHQPRALVQQQLIGLLVPVAMMISR